MGAFISPQFSVSMIKDSLLESNRPKRYKYFVHFIFAILIKYFVHFIFAILIKYFISFMNVFDEFEQLVGVCLKNSRLYSIFKTICNTKILFRSLFVLCLSGAFLKFYSSLMAILFSIA